MMEAFFITYGRTGLGIRSAATATFRQLNPQIRTTCITDNRSAIAVDRVIDWQDATRTLMVALRRQHGVDGRHVAARLATARPSARMMVTQRLLRIFAVETYSSGPGFSWYCDSDLIALGKMPIVPHRFAFAIGSHFGGNYCAGVFGMRTGQDVAGDLLGYLVSGYANAAEWNHDLDERLVNEWVRSTRLPILRLPPYVFGGCSMLMRGWDGVLPPNALRRTSKPAIFHFCWTTDEQARLIKRLSVVGLLRYTGSIDVLRRAAKAVRQMTRLENAPGRGRTLCPNK